jgi:hypothetical protein
MDQTTLVARLWALTQDIEQAAAIADWQTAARLTEERNALFTSLTAAQQPGDLATLRKIQAIDARIMTDAHTTRTELQQEYRESMKRIRAADQYGRMAQM